MGRNTGSALETLIENSAYGLEGQGLSLRLTTPPFKGRVGSDGRASGYFAAKGGLDFTGDYYGQAVYIDAKVVSGDTLPINERCLKPHQVEIVRLAATRGAVAFFLVEVVNGFTSDYWALGWDVLAGYVEAAATGGRKSIPVKDLKAQAWPIALKPAGLDLIGAVKEMRDRRRGARVG